MRKIVDTSTWLNKRFETYQKVEEVFKTVHPFFNPTIRHYKKRDAKFQDIKSMDLDPNHCPIKNLEKCIENGDTLAQNALHFFQNTMWGKDCINGKTRYDHALNCIELDILDGDIFPAQSLKQANLFIKRLTAAAKWTVTRKEVVSEIPEQWSIESDWDIYHNKNLICETEVVPNWRADSSYGIKRAKQDPWGQIKKLHNGDIGIKYHYLEMKKDNSYDPTDDVVGWGNGYGD